jgi:hypothetical protein
LLRVILASVPAVGFAIIFREFGFYDLIPGQLGLLVGLIVTWAFGVLSYALIASFLQVSELHALKGLIVRKLRGSQVA